MTSERARSWGWGACALALALQAPALGCAGETGRDRVQVPLSGRGGAPEPFEVDGFTITLDEARIGLGPIYFCAGTAASSERCPSAVAELAGSVVLDGLDPDPQPLGELSALSGAVRSAALDYAITWPTTAAEPVVLDAAPEGHSAYFEGRAESAGAAFAFVAGLDVLPALRGTQALSGLAARGQIGERSRCTLAFDPGAAFAQVDFAELAGDGGAGSEPIEIEPGSRAYEALIVALTSSTPPTVTWSEDEPSDDLGG